MKYIGLILLAVLAVIVLLLLIAVLRTLLMPSKTSTYVADEPEEEALALAEKLSKLERGAAIPPEIYEVVAEILVFVDDMDKMKAKLQQADMLS